MDINNYAIIATHYLMSLTVLAYGYDASVILSVQHDQNSTDMIMIFMSFAIMAFCTIHMQLI